MSGVWQYRRNSNHDFCDEARPPVRVPPMTEKLIPALLVSSWKCSGSDLRLLAKKSWSDPVPGRAFHPAVDQRFSRRTVNAWLNQLTVANRSKTNSSGAGRVSTVARRLSSGHRRSADRG